MSRHRRRPRAHPGDRGRQEQLDAAGDRQQAVLGDLLRQRADLGRQRRLQRPLRQRLYLLCRLPRQRSSAAGGGHLPRRRRHLGQQAGLAGPQRRPPALGAVRLHRPHRQRRSRVRLLRGVPVAVSGLPPAATHLLVKSFDGGELDPPDPGPAGHRPLLLRRPGSSPAVSWTGSPGARSDLAAAPSADIANGAPTGADATDEIVLTWVDGRDGLNDEHVMVSYSTNQGASWSAPAAVENPATDRGYYSAPALSPDGTDLYLVYNAFTTPFRNDTTSPRGLVGVVLHANIGAGAPTGWTVLHRGAVGDPRGLEPEQPAGRVPRRLCVRGRHPNLWRGGLERRPQRRRVPGHQRLAGSAAGRAPPRHQPPTSTARRPSATPTSSEDPGPTPPT